MPTDGLNSWENTIEYGDAFYLQYQAHKTSTRPTKRIKLRDKHKIVDKKGEWQHHAKVSKSRYSFSENLNNSSINTISETRKPRHSKKPGFEFEYPNVVPYNQILVPKSFYVKKKLNRKSYKSKQNPKVSPALKNTRKKKHHLKRSRKNRNSIITNKIHQDKRITKKLKLNRTKKSNKNPISNIFRGIYYQYFTQKDRQLGPDIYPVSNLYLEIYSARIYHDKTNNIIMKHIL